MIEYKILSEDEYECIKNKYQKDLSKFKVSKKPPTNYYSLNRKKQQRIINAYVKKINKSIENDYLWMGRFFVRQISVIYFNEFDDKSGASMMVKLRIYDSKQLRYIDTYGTVSEFCCFNGYRLWLRINKAITEHFTDRSQKRDDPENPHNDRIDYMSVCRDNIIGLCTPLYDYEYHLSDY